MENEKKYPIYIMLFLVMVAWGFNVIATKVIVMAFPPIMVTSFRILVAGVCVFIILSFLQQVRLPSKREGFFIFWGALFNVLGHQYFISIALTQTTATNAGLILGMGPLLTTILAIIFLGNRLNGIRLIGILLGLMGVFFIILQNGRISGLSIGDVNAFISILSMAISFIIIKKAATSLDPRLMTAYMLVIGAIFLFIVSLLTEPNALQQMGNGTLNLWLLFWGSAILSTALGHMFYNYGIGKVGAAEAAIFTNLSPFFAVVGAVVFLHEALSISQIIGFMFIVLGVILGSGAYEEIQKGRKRKRNVGVLE
ncbi:DMT family transporter [Bacillus salitolerans]|uniref:DMT family transporter n=1 Tax=Bacillus salitolerans TaxID=1437434 RepID=A0ABW4LR51_9BACI